MSGITGDTLLKEITVRVFERVERELMVREGEDDEDGPQEEVKQAVGRIGSDNSLHELVESLE